MSKHYNHTHWRKTTIVNWLILWDFIMLKYILFNVSICARSPPHSSGLDIKLSFIHSRIYAYNFSRKLFLIPLFRSLFSRSLLFRFVFFKLVHRLHHNFAFSILCTYKKTTHTHKLKHNYLKVSFRLFEIQQKYLWWTGTIAFVNHVAIAMQRVVCGIQISRPLYA